MAEKVAIILVNYNGWNDTIECLHSLEKIYYTNYEVIIVDNASTDMSVMMIENYLSKTCIKCKIIKNKINYGFSGANNIGIKYALTKGFKYFLMLNNDTIVKPDFLLELLKVFNVQNVGAATGKIYYLSNPKMIWYAGGKINKINLKPSHEHYQEIDITPRHEKKMISFATGCCILLSEECLRTVGYWDENFFLYEEDVDLSIRILKSGFYIRYNSDAMLYHKVNASTGKISDLSTIYQVRNRFMIIKKYLSGTKKIVAYIYAILMLINRIRKKEYTLKNVVNGMKAFICNKKGRYS